MNPDLLDQLRALLGPSRTVSTPLPPVMVTAPAREMTMGPRGTEPSYAPPSGMEQAVGMARDMASYMRNNPVETAMSFVPGVSEVQDAVTGVREALQGNMGGAAANLAMAGVGLTGLPLVDVARLGRRVPAAARDAMVMENPRFRRWFGNSTVTDPATGLPQTVMHATDATQIVRGTGGVNPLTLDDIVDNNSNRFYVRPVNFDTFRMPEEGKRQLGIHVGVDPRQGDRFASYSTSPEQTTKMMQAVDFVENLTRSMPDADPGNLYQSVGQFINPMMKQGGRNMPLYVRAENPLRLADYGSWSGPSMAKSMRETAPDVAEQFERQYGDIEWARESALRRFLKGEGFDSIVYRNRFEGVPQSVTEQLNPKGMPRLLPESEWAQTPVADSYILFSPRQIKSAIGNVGTYRRDTGNINRGLLMGLLGGGAAGGLGEYVANSAPPEG